MVCRITSAEEGLAATQASSKQEVERLQAELDKCAPDQPMLCHMHFLLSILHGTHPAYMWINRAACIIKPPIAPMQADQSVLQV